MNNHIMIVTFGNFDIRYNNKSLLGKAGKRSLKIMDLLKFFITFQDKNLLPEAIIDKVFADTETQDPKNALRTQIYRMRKMAAEITQDIIAGDESYFALDFQNGFYVFSLNEQCCFDASVFSRLIDQANKIKDTDPKQALILYAEALSLYKGEYLAENQYCEWAIPFRNRYQRLYFRALLDQLELLKHYERYADIVEACEDGLQIDPYEESVYVYYLEALLELGQINQAGLQYKFIVNKLSQELGVKPSARLRETFQKIKGYGQLKEANRGLLDIIGELQDDDPPEAAFYCQMDEFRAIYNLERRKSSRCPSSSFLGYVTLACEPNDAQSRDLKHILTDSRRIVQTSLRREDVVTKYRDDKLLLILSNAKEESLPMIARRIEKAFFRHAAYDNIAVSVRFYPIAEAGILL